MEYKRSNEFKKDTNSNKNASNIHSSTAASISQALNKLPGNLQPTEEVIFNEHATQPTTTLQPNNNANNNDNLAPPQFLENDTASDDNDEGFEGEDFPEKRFNSLAWLVQGNDRCGAAYFDGKTLFLATNEFFPSIIFNKVASFLNKTACKAKILSSLSPNESSIDMINNLSQSITEAIDDITNILENGYFKNEYFLDEIVYRKNVTRSLFKVAFSIITHFFQQNLQDFLSSPPAINQCNEVMNTYFIELNTKFKLSISDTEFLKRRFSNIQEWLQPYAEKGEERIFKKDLIDALLANNIKFIDAKPVLSLPGRQLHAEMKILQHIYDEHKNDIKNGNLQSLQSQSYYIGIGKLCCINCKCAIDAFNQVIMEKGAQANFIQLRSNQGSVEFPALVPDFLRNKNFAIKFLQLRYPELEDNIKNVYRRINRAFNEHAGRTVHEHEMREPRSKAKSKSDDKSKSRRSKNTQPRHKEQSTVSSSPQSSGYLDAANLGASISQVTNQSNIPVYKRTSTPSSRPRRYTQQRLHTDNSRTETASFWNNSKTRNEQQESKTSEQPNSNFK